MAARVGLDRQSIVIAAAKIADLDGLDNVTLAAVANLLGIRKPSLYNHVNGMPELRGLLAIRGTTELKTTITEAVIGKAKADAIHAMAEAYRTFARQRPGLYRAIVSSPDRNNNELQTAITSLMSIIRTVLKPYSLDDNDNTHTARALRSLMHGFVSLEAAGWFQIPLDRAESYRLMIDTFIRGLDAST
ncbi:MAG: TetR/AcrR family transcriptional regulator [Firmicutes bacterium]|nr:TetR/AcrR family transcriptional regulator [Bacillota bacterium]